MQDDILSLAAVTPAKRRCSRPPDSQPDVVGLGAATVAQMAKRRQEKYGGSCLPGKHCAASAAAPAVAALPTPPLHQESRRLPAHPRPAHTAVLQVCLFRSCYAVQCAVCSVLLLQCAVCRCCSVQGAAAAICATASR